MASEEMESEVQQGGGLGQPLLIVAALAAGAAAALGAKALMDSRRKGDVGRPDSDEDLPTVLRRATLDLAIAATNQAAERLGEDQSEADEEAAVESS